MGSRRLTNCVDRVFFGGVSVKRREPPSSADVKQDQWMTEEAMMDLSVEELREFLQADLLDVPVDPKFKERLKRKLWELVQEQAQRRRQAES